MPEERSKGDEYLFDVLVFLAASARGCVDEPPSYGSFRLIDALSKLADLPEHVPCLKADVFLKSVKAEIEKKKFLVITDPEGFKRFLDELVREFAKELKRRKSRVS